MYYYTEIFAYMHFLVFCNTQGAVARIGTEKQLLVILKREERKPTRCNNIDGLLSIMDVGY